MTFESLQDLLQSHGQEGLLQFYSQLSSEEQDSLMPEESEEWNMNIPIKEAIAHFFSNPSFDLIFSEAVANALDAGASDIKISISIKAYNF